MRGYCFAIAIVALDVAVPQAGLAATDGKAGAVTAPDTSEAVVVTGTRWKTNVQKSLSPITIVNSAQLRRTGMTDLRDALATLEPSLSRQAVGFDTANLTDSIKMRGLRV